MNRQLIIQEKEMGTYRNLLLSFLFLICCSSAIAHFAMPQLIPTERLIKNTNAYIAENPKDPKGHYNLARIHYMAFINKSFKVGAFERNDLIQVAPGHLQGSVAYRLRLEYAKELILKEMKYSSESDIPKKDSNLFWKSVQQKLTEIKKENWQPTGPSNSELFRHAELASQSFKKAISLDSDNGLYYLGYASLLKQYVDFVNEIKSDHLPPQFQTIILDRAKELFYKAYELSIRKDLKHKYRPIAGLHCLVGYEAGNAYVKLLEAEKSISKGEMKKFVSVNENLAKLEKLKVNAITPVIFSFNKQDCLSDLLAENTTVSFDLDGNGIIEEWPWVKPDTGILVWDPEGTGKITSGRQLFGSVTWWLFFEDGYHAMDALDDSRDGQLSGDELDGISVWFDENTNGISDAGEVTPVKELGIAALSTKSDAKEDGCPISTKGLRLENGEVKATYDWIAVRDQQQ